MTLLYHNSYLNRFYMPTIPGQGGSPAVYYLGAAGRKYLKVLGINAKTINKPGQRIQMFLDHTLAVNDVWVEAEKLDREGVWKLVRWLTPTDIITEKNLWRSGTTTFLGGAVLSYVLIDRQGRVVSADAVASVSELITTGGKGLTEPVNVLLGPHDVRQATASKGRPASSFPP